MNMTTLEWDDSHLYTYKAQIVSVYDGDTVTADISLGFGIWMRGQKLRLLGIDTPELRGEERELGLVSRDALRERILDKEVLIKTHRDSKGKYGRWLAEIIIEGENVNNWLINEGLAKPY